MRRVAFSHLKRNCNSYSNQYLYVRTSTRLKTKCLKSVAQLAHCKFISITCACSVFRTFIDMMNPLDYYDLYYRPFTGSPFDYSSLSAQPLYPPESSMASAAPTALQQQLVPVHPYSAPLDYRSWCASIYDHLGGTYCCDPAQSMHLTQSKQHPVRGITNNASVAANALELGPGPPIVTDDRVRGPRGCNLFVFHLPNEMTNW